MEGELLVLGMDNPPVNCLSLPLRQQLFEVLTTRTTAPEVRAVILVGTGKYFCAGGDLRELGTPAADAAPRISAGLLPAIEQCSKPVIAGLHGAAFGGGFELALACHYRISNARTRLALPELRHGIIPLSGTQRLPRLWGIVAALQFMLEAREVSARSFAGSAVFDEIVESENILRATIDFARRLMIDKAPNFRAQLVRNRPRKDSDPSAALAAAINSYGADALTAAQRALIEAVRGGVEHSNFDVGLKNAQRLYDELIDAAHRRTRSIH